MKYADLIDPENLTYSENIFNQNSDEKFTIRRSFSDNSYFISFLPKPWKNKHPKSLATNWKARLSIHPEDLDKAWEIIYPILCQNAATFKVANRNTFKKLMDDRKQKLDRLLRHYNQFLADYDADCLDYHSLRNKYYELSKIINIYNPNQWRFVSFAQYYYTKLANFFSFYFLSKDQLFIHTRQKYEQLIEQRKQKVANSSRFYEGMQFTLYILQGLEKNLQLMLKEIEILLLRENIRPGIIYPTDRQIGIYSSIRHPGKTYYHDAISVDNYNPDNANDPFDFLETIPTEEIIQENDYLQQQSKQTTQFIIHALTMKKFISPTALKAMAKHKEDVVDYIKNLPLDARKKLVTESLDKSTNLGAFFRVQRGIFKPRLSRGTLQEIERERKLLA
ncbi:hypothetical protein [Legionella brunensis]|uniref:Ankyrin repeat protein n=1 Tax=Legionella brunensis TaxID=29422 RepID=A0A0W0SDC5_9GAMM|nr:hypothetical protein [Legionella brunensis]KTC81484.1 ankyrin repeat protein [Legionella brunensis]